MRNETRATGWGGNRGIALIDLLVALVILAIAAGGVFAAFRTGLSAWITAQQFQGEQQHARLVMDWVARRLRSAGNGFAGSPTVATRIAVANAGEIVFYGDTNGNGRVECIRLYRSVSEGIVYINFTEAGSPLPTLPASCSGGAGIPLTTAVEAKAFRVTDLRLRYYSNAPGTGAELAAPVTDPLLRASIARIAIEVDVQQVRGSQFAGTSTGGVFSMSTQVTLRID